MSTDTIAEAVVLRPLAIMAKASELLEARRADVSKNVYGGAHYAITLYGTTHCRDKGLCHDDLVEAGVSALHDTCRPCKEKSEQLFRAVMAGAHGGAPASSLE